MSWGVANSENWDLNNSFSAFFSFYLVRPSSYYLCCSWHPHHSTCTTMCITSGRNTTRVEPENIWLGNRFVNFYAPWQGHPLQEIGSKLGYTRRDLFCICVHGHWLSTACTTGAKKNSFAKSIGCKNILLWSITRMTIGGKLSGRKDLGRIGGVCRWRTEQKRAIASGGSDSRLELLRERDNLCY